MFHLRRQQQLVNETTKTGKICVAHTIWSDTFDVNPVAPGGIPAHLAEEGVVEVTRGQAATTIADPRRSLWRLVSAINAVRGKQSMAEFAREAIAREVQRRLTETEKGRK